MQHKVVIASAVAVVLLCTGLIGWQAWSIGQIREEITALQQQVAGSGNSLLAGAGTQTQPVPPPASLFGGNGANNLSPGSPFSNQNSAFEEFDRLQAEMFDHMQQLLGTNTPGGLFDDNFFADAFGFDTGVNGQDPDLQMREQDDSYVITIDIPEDSNAEVSASVDGNELNIEGNITIKNDGSNTGSTFSSTQSRQFARSMPLPPDADPDGLTNVTEDGQVVITIPKQA